MLVGNNVGQRFVSLVNLVLILNKAVLLDSNPPLSPFAKGEGYVLHGLIEKKNVSSQYSHASQQSVGCAELAKRIVRAKSRLMRFVPQHILYRHNNERTF